MDLTYYTEEKYAAMNQDLPPEPASETPVPEKKEEAKVLTAEENERLFFDFEENKIFIGKFEGPGDPYTVNAAGGEQAKIETWAFTDLNGLSWCIPRWLMLDVPQGPFQGLSREVPGTYVYYIEYVEMIRTANGNRHILKIFRKQSD